MSRRGLPLPAFLTAAAAGLAVRALYERCARFEISEASMSPTLVPGDYVLTQRLPQPPERGDIVVFEHPLRTGFHLVKRVVGMPGEAVAVEAGRVLIDGTPLDEPWTTDETGPEGEWKLDKGEAFVLGDARWMSSADSREIGPIPLDRLGMQVTFRYWPASRIGPVR